ncbi:MAG: NUDIX domain-containing protein [Ruminococcaceae bacterium]|nr:NUDIX domain-containing protein [Oscillospiraceae bacterium]
MDGRLRCMTGIYLTCKGRFYLLYRQGGSVVSDCYTGTAGGHFEPHELNDARACVLRELYEETGLSESDISDLRMRYITLRLKNGEVRQNYYFFAELKEPAELKSSEGEIRCFSREELSALPMPESAYQMLTHYLAEGCETDLLYSGAHTQRGMIFAPLTEF